MYKLCPKFTNRNRERIWGVCGKKGVDEMNTMERNLYEFLMEQGDKYISQAEIARELYGEFGNGECCLEPKDYHNTYERCIMLRCKQRINDSVDFEKIIISNSKGMKIATEEEAEQYLANQYKALFRKLRRLRTMERKCNLHNQITVDGHTIDAFLQNLPENY